MKILPEYENKEQEVVPLFFVLKLLAYKTCLLRSGFVMFYLAGFFYRRLSMTLKFYLACMAVVLSLDHDCVLIKIFFKFYLILITLLKCIEKMHFFLNSFHH